MSLVQGVALTEPGSVARIPVPASRPGNEVRDGGGSERPLGFSDLLDILNPLQHIPGVSEIYRSVTGDQMSEGARFAGNALYGLALGGPLGLAGMTAYSMVGQAADTHFSADPALQEAGDILRTSQTMASNTDTPPPPPVPPKKPENSSLNVLGAEVGAATASAQAGPLDLTRLSATVNSTESEVDVAPLAKREKMPTGEQLEAIAAHSSNRLPIDVLKALQERHETLVAHEQS
ncbi:hypothetical protein [Labrenzia sp. CE80]|uniref:hypothetical protein n=1 Tax=Labrenzia sp. CE80 TaxID=1788986 RepID=UPI00129BDF33|nr:hypothetical protein [Labrenzia sp. CE80]